MNTVRRIAKNTTAMLFGEVTGKLLSLVFVIYAARYLQAEGFGVLSFALAFVGMFGIFSDIGFYELTVREVARNKQLAGKYVGNIMILKVLLVIIVFGLICLTINLMNYPVQTILIVYIIGLSIVFDAFSIISNAIFQAFEKFEYITIGTVLRGLLLVAGGIAAIHNRWDIVAFAYIYMLASLSVLGCSMFLMLKKFTRPRFEVDIKLWKWLFKEGLPFWASAILAVILHNVDKVMLSMMVGNVAVGYYSAAYRLISSLNIIPLAFIASIYPVTSRLYISSNDSLKFAFERSFKYMLVLGAFVGIAVMLLSGEIINFIYGKEYSPSAIILQILIWAEVIFFINVTSGNLLKSINRQIIITYLLIFAVTLNIIMNWLLIPKYSYIGASFATVMSRFCVFLLVMSWIMRSDYRLSNEILMSAVKMVAFLLVAGLLFYLFSINTYLFLMLFTGAFLAVLYLLKIIDETDKKLIRNAILFFRTVRGEE